MDPTDSPLVPPNRIFTNAVSANAVSNKVFFFLFKPYTLNEYCKVASSNTTRFEAHAGLFRFSIKGILDADVL